MNHTKTDDPNAAASATSSDDTRKEWVTPAIEEIPINASRGTITPPGPDLGLYS